MWKFWKTAWRLLMTAFGDGFARGFKRIGHGVQVRGLTKPFPIRVRSFQLGVVRNNDPEETPEGSATELIDFDIGPRDTLKRGYGTAGPVVTYVGVPVQIAAASALAGHTNIFVFSPPDIITHCIDPLLTSSTALEPYAWTSFGDVFIYSNRVGQVKVYTFGASAFVLGVHANDPLIPPARTYASAVGRVFIGGFDIGGVFNAMAVGWSGPASYNAFNFGVDLGSGFELLVNDQTYGDEILAIRSLGLDAIAIVCRRSVWVGRRTGDLDRPMDFQPRVTGRGAVWKTTVVSVSGGVMYLSNTGVQLFNGNEAVMVSEAINDLILPVKMDQLNDYSASFDPVTNEYWLHTPDRTFIFDAIRGRWRTSAMIAIGSALFTDILVPDQTLKLVLGDPPGAAGPELHYYVPFPELVMGSFVRPTFESRVLSADFIDRNFTVSEIQMKYRCEPGFENVVQFTLLDANGEFAQAQPPIVLDGSGEWKVARQTVLETGRGVGVKLQVVSGQPEIMEIELTAMPRSRMPRSLSTIFSP
jgi:hypothetical protein